jgi:hypothetical protein
MSSQRVIIDTMINGFDCRLEFDVSYYVDQNIIHHPNGYDFKVENYINIDEATLIDVESEQIPSDVEILKWTKLNKQLIINEILL